MKTEPKRGLEIVAVFLPNSYKLLHVKHLYKDLKGNI